jgi:hypothetical protein
LDKDWTATWTAQGYSAQTKWHVPRESPSENWKENFKKSIILRLLKITELILKNFPPD